MQRYNVVIRARHTHLAWSRFKDVGAIAASQSVEVGDTIALRHPDDPHQITRFLVYDMIYTPGKPWTLMLMPVQVDENLIVECLVNAVQS